MRELLPFELPNIPGRSASVRH